MEAYYKKIKLVFKDLRLALIFMGILMLVISHYLPSVVNGNVKEILMFLGVLVIIIGVLCIVLPYIINKFE